MEDNQKPPDHPTPSPERTAQFVQLYSQNYQRLQYFLMALLPTSNDASDVLQETSLVLWSKFETFELGTNFYAWACKIARLQSLKFYERNRRKAVLFAADTLDKIADDAFSYAQDNTLPIEALDSCLAALSEADNKLIRRRYEPGVQVGRMADEIGVTANALSKSLYRIRRSLLSCLQRKLAHEAS